MISDKRNEEPRQCEACGTIGRGQLARIRTTNGSLFLCEQCLSDINRNVYSRDAAIADAMEYKLDQLTAELERLREVNEKLLAACQMLAEFGKRDLDNGTFQNDWYSL